MHTSTHAHMHTSDRVVFRLYVVGSMLPWLGCRCPRQFLVFLYEYPNNAFTSGALIAVVVSLGRVYCMSILYVGLGLGQVLGLGLGHV